MLGEEPLAVEVIIEGDRLKGRVKCPSCATILRPSYETKNHTFHKWFSNSITRHSTSIRHAEAQQGQENNE